MAKISKKSATILIVLISVGIVFTSRYFVRRVRANDSGEMAAKVKGDASAPIKVIEFIDFQCPACAFGAAYLKTMVEKYPDAIRVELKHFPLQMHHHGFLSSKYAECAAQQGKFWDFQDKMLARQNNWKRLADAVPAFDQIAKETGVDTKVLGNCLDDESVDEIINGNKEEGKALGVKSTPTYFVNDKMIVGKKSLESEIKKLLEEHGF